MPPALVRSRRLALVGSLAAIATVAGCSLGGETELPPYTDPATVTYDTSTGVTIANMTRVNAQLYTQDIVVGTGATVATGDSISVYYSGRLATGFRFDSRARPDAPIVLKLDSISLIRGWSSGLVGMRVGGTRRLAVGPEFGYGYRTVVGNGVTLIPSNSVLAFDVEITATTPPTS